MDQPQLHIPCNLDFNSYYNINMSDVESEDVYNIHNQDQQSMSVIDSHRENQQQPESAIGSKTNLGDNIEKPAHHSSIFSQNKGGTDTLSNQLTITPKKKKLSKKKLQREESDFNFPDPDGRTLLHRSALEQNIKLINDVIDEFTSVLQSSQQDKTFYLQRSNIQDRIIKYVNQPDKFKLTPILLCCFKNLDVEPSLLSENRVNERFECIKGLFRRNADLNVKNPRTLWSPVFWCAYYGDAQSVQFILENNGICFEPDAGGLYPLDHAGNKGHRDVCKIIVEYLVNLLDEFQKYLNNDLFCGNDDIKHIFYQDLEKNHKKMLQIPILPAKILFWICHFNFGLELVEKVMRYPRVYFNVKLYTLQRMTALHAAAQANIFEDIANKEKKLQAKREAEKESQALIKKILEYQIKDEDEEGLVKQYEHIINTRPRLGRNHVHQLTSIEKDMYDDRYKKEIIQFAKWERNFYSKIQDELYYRQEFLDKSIDKSRDQQFYDPKVAPQTVSPEEPVKQEADINIDIPKVDDMQSSGQQGELMRLDESSFFTKPTLELDIPDIYGNTPLHWASLKGNKSIVEVLLEKNANMEVENQEFFKARELSKYDDVLKFYEEKLQAKLKEENKQLIEVKEIAEITIKKLYTFTVRKQESEDVMLGIRRKKASSKRKMTQAQVEHKFSELEQAEELLPAVKELFEYTHKLFVPDYVIKLQLKESDKSPQLFFTYLTKNQGDKNDSSAHQSLNFQISLLQNAGFIIYLMKSYNEQGFHYIMLKHEESKLEEEAEIMQLQVKLIDGYDLEPFKRILQDQYEPFRSRQRQEIIESHVKRIINLEQLQKAEVFHSFYRMHNFGGIERLNREWISQRRWYWPQPFCQIQNYIMEGQTQNFQALTTMRLYLGEKISFYFAWKSYLTCALLAIALPGLALQIYIIRYNQYQSELLPYWVFYVCIWSTLQVEFWKRKTSEINTRWGCIDLMENEDAEQKVLRESFIGDEEISDTTGELTKHQKKSETIILLMISFPVLSIFVGMAIAIFLGVQYLQNTYAKNDDVLRIILGVLQGVGITMLNLIYTFIAKWFVHMENHKYRGAYETSLIYKNVLFKLINSYLSIFYFIFQSDKTLKDIFFLMLPVLIVKQVNYIILSVFVPQALYQRAENKYFRKIQKTTTSQFIFQENQRKRRQQNYLDPIQQFYKARLNINHRAVSRAVIKVEQDEVIGKRISEGKRIQLEQTLDTDAVELNSLKLDFEGTLNYFMEGIIDYGYITLFAAAFPIGPAIAMIVSVPEIRMKVYSFLYVYKRPNCDRCSGIGEWLNVIELMSVFGVFSNFILLNQKQKQQTLDIYQSNKQIKQNSDLQILFFILSIVILMLIKTFFKEVIPDKPVWVCQEIEKMKKKQDNEAGRRNAEQLKVIENQIEDERKKLRKIKHRIKIQAQREQIKNTNQKIT